MDQIFIRDLLVRCVVGVDERERMSEQDVLVHLTLYTDLRRAGRTDALDGTVDYKAVKKQIMHVAENSRSYLIEALAQKIADACLSYERVEKVRVTVEKPGVLRFARTVGVEIVRCKHNGIGEGG